VIHSPYPWSHSVVLVPGCTDWLAEISSDVREAVAYLRYVRDDALYKSTATLLYFTNCTDRISSALVDSCNIIISIIIDE